MTGVTMSKGFSWFRLAFLLVLGGAATLLGWYFAEPRVLPPFKPQTGLEWATAVEHLVTDAKRNDGPLAGHKLKTRLVAGGRAELSLESLEPTDAEQVPTLVITYPRGDGDTLPRPESIRPALAAKDTYVLSFALP